MTNRFTYELKGQDISSDADQQGKSTTIPEKHVNAYIYRSHRAHKNLGREKEIQATLNNETLTASRQGK